MNLPEKKHPEHSSHVTALTQSLDSCPVILKKAVVAQHNHSAAAPPWTQSLVQTYSCVSALVHTETDWINTAQSPVELFYHHHEPHNALTHSYGAEHKLCLSNLSQ